MRDLDHAMTLIDATVGAVTVPVTLKMRLGWDERSINAPELARRAQDSGVRLITGARTNALPVLQRPGRLEHGACRKGQRFDSARGGTATSAPTRTLPQRWRLRGADAVMVGRAAQGRPWLPGQIGRRLAGGRRESAPQLPHAIR